MLLVQFELITLLNFYNIISSSSKRCCIISCIVSFEVSLCVSFDVSSVVIATSYCGCCFFHYYYYCCCCLTYPCATFCCFWFLLFVWQICYLIVSVLVILCCALSLYQKTNVKLDLRPEKTKRKQKQQQQSQQEQQQKETSMMKYQICFKIFILLML